MTELDLPVARVRSDAWALELELAVTRICAALTEHMAPLFIAEGSWGPFVLGGPVSHEMNWLGTTIATDLNERMSP